MSEFAADAKEIRTDTDSHNTQPLNAVQNTERDISQTELSHCTAMPSIVSIDSPDSSKDEQVFKLEPGTETVNIVAVSSGGEPAQFENDACGSLGGHEHSAAFIGEEPLEIQCGENTALLYVSKLCQGSKGPCILFNNEWLTPNELQYISGRETAKDWKRSIRFKGKSLKSLIARGLIKVHPPICDCLGCRISSPVNRGRLASKCGIAPPSPRSRKRDASKSLSCWTHDQLEAATGHRHYSTSDIDGYAHHALINGYKDSRPDSNSSGTSECSDGHDENPFSPAVKRPCSSSPDITLVEKPRRASDSSVTQYLHAPKDYDKALSLRRMIQLQEDKDTDVNNELSSRNDKKNTNKTRSAFRSVQQDETSSMTPAVSEGDMAAMRAVKIKQSASGPTSPFLPPYSQYGSGTALVSPTSPRLVPDPLLFGTPHASNIYHHAFRGAGYHGVPQLPRNLMQYRLVSPPGTGTPPGMPIQSQLLMQDLAAMTTNGSKLYEKKSRGTEENGVPRKRRRSSNEHSDNDKSSYSVFSDDENGSPKKENSEKNHVSVIHKSPAQSPLTVDTGSEVKNSSPSSRSTYTCNPHRLIPKLRLNTDENVLQWDVNQVCEFISSLTGSSEIVNEFKEQCIDGQSLILLKEDHLLTKLGIKLGPALKILAHIQKLLEIELDPDHGTDNSDLS